MLQKTYARDFLADRRILNTGQAPQKYVENNHPAIVDRTTWNAAQAERQRRVSLRSVMETGKGRYSGLYAFSGKIECGVCGAGFRRHASRGEGVWVCKQHIQDTRLCGQLAIKESYLERVFVRTLNSLLINRDKVIDVVGTAVKEAMIETGDAFYNSDELKKIDAEIDSLQSAQMELSKKRSRRELDADTYNNESRIIMAKIDGLFAARDNLSEKQSVANLSVAYQEIVDAFLEKAQEQDRFDRDIFAQLVDTIHIKNRENILFILKDGTEVFGITDDIEG